MIDDLFARGRGISAYPLRIQLGTFPKHQGLHYQVGFSVPKRQWKRAVDRNRIKRLLREVYRHHHHSLTEPYQQEEDMLVLLIIYVSKDLPTIELLEKAWTKAVKKINIAHSDE